MRLEKIFRFEAAHALPLHPGKCSRLHGHSWVLHVFIEGQIDSSTGMVMDYGDIKSNVQFHVDRFLDHHFLNDYVHNPTSENVVLFIADRLTATNFSWSALALEETCTSSCYLTRKEYIDARQTALEERKEDGEDGQEETQEVTDDDIPF